MYECVGDNAATAEQVVAGATMTKEAVEQVGKEISHISKLVDEVGEQVKAGSERSEELIQDVMKMKEVANESLDVNSEKMKSNEERIEKAMKDLKSLSRINEMVDQILEITSQTNLLSLNASIEAARAGEQGRGFAVVAGEVRNLASRSAQAAKEIKGLIEESVNRVQQGSKLVNNAAATMIDIVSSVTRVNDIMGEIASASEEQQRGIEQVAQAVSQMDQVTQQNASLVEEAAVATEQLANQADHLSSRVAVFTLEEHEVARHESAQLQIAPVVS